MKALNKIVIILLLTLLTFSALSVLTGSVNAAGNLACKASISSKSSGVDQATSYSFIVTNTGESNLGSINITIPSAYSHVGNLVISQEPPSQSWTITEGAISKGNDTLLYGSAEGLSPGQSITFTFDATNPKPEGTYTWIIGANENTSATALNTPEFTLDISQPIVINSVFAATLIFFIATVIAFINTALNRVLINYFVGWEQYRVMQKEMNEYRSETMAAMRANDKKQVEKLKKRESQIKNMQAQMLKPQMVQFGFSFVYIIIWFLVLTPTFGGTSMVYVPGIGGIPVLYWYPIGSFFLGLLASRLIGIMPIET